MNITGLIKKAHDNAVNKGFYEDAYIGKTGKNVGELLMLVVSELSEALEAHRKNVFPQFEMFQEMLDSGASFTAAFETHIKDSFQDELADAVIRICDLCGYFKIDLENHIKMKMWYNESREYKHGKAY